jgi:glycosyltransferase involved in cell wall biosynthesis
LPRAANRNDPGAGSWQKVSAYILAYNVAKKIKAAVETVLWADEIVVVDSHSTEHIAESLGALVVHVPFNGFGDLRNRAVEACRYGWIFSLDADERCTEAVRDEILSLLSGSPSHDAYRMPRRNHMMATASAVPAGIRTFVNCSYFAKAPCATHWSRCTKAMSF